MSIPAVLSIALVVLAAREDAKPQPPEAPAVAKDHVVREGKVTVAGAAIDYVSTAGTLPLLTEEGKERARIFFVAYTRAGAADPARPLTFAFNGGPGSSSVWLHLGAFGPRRIELAPDGTAPPPPWRLVDNEATLLGVTDLVFVDPITTGYSRAAAGEKAGDFHGVEEDASAVAEFIRLYTTQFERWAAPKFLAGESYGTTRAARLADLLQDRHGMFLSGVVLVSAILNFQTSDFDRGNDLAYALILPTYTATAFFHGALAPELQRDLKATLAEAERYAGGDFVLALQHGARLDPGERAAAATAVARLTGLTPEFVARNNLRVEQGEFCKELLRARGVTVGRLDSRFLGNDADAAGSRPDFDPSYANIQGCFTAAMNDYVRRDLGYQSNLPYEILTGRVQPWNTPARGRYLNVGEDLRRALAENPHLTVFLGSGYHDMATPYFAADYTMDHLTFDAAQRARIRTRYYEAGHMMYIDASQRARLATDLAEYYRDALTRR